MKPLILLLLVAVSAPVAAQSTPDWGGRARGDTLVTITGVAGLKVHGWIVARDEHTLVVRAVGGQERRLRREAVASIEPARGRVESGVFRRDDMSYSRLLYAPSGRPLRGGEGCVALHAITFPSIAYGITDNFSVLGGMTYIPDLDNAQMLYVMPSIGVRLEEGFEASFGALYVRFKGESGGIAYASAALGHPEMSLTAGVGYPYAGEGDRLSDVTIVGIGATVRVTKRTALVSENWFFLDGTDGTQIYSGGLRTFPSFLPGLSYDLGFIAIIDRSAGLALPLPWASATYSFGQ